MMAVSHPKGIGGHKSTWAKPRKRRCPACGRHIWVLRRDGGLALHPRPGHWPIEWCKGSWRGALAIELNGRIGEARLLFQTRAKAAASRIADGHPIVKLYAGHLHRGRFYCWRCSAHLSRNARRCPGCSCHLRWGKLTVFTERTATRFWRRIVK